MFLPDPDFALGRVAAPVAPGGSRVAVVWGTAEADASISVAAATLAEVVDLAPLPDKAPGLFDLGRPGVLGAAFLRAGLDDVH